MNWNEHLELGSIRARALRTEAAQAQRAKEYWEGRAAVGWRWAVEYRHLRLVLRLT